MGGLNPWQALPPGGVVVPDADARPRTGRWRTGLRPEPDLSRCVNCLLCWLYCPDSAVLLDGLKVTGIDLERCKGCEICADRCPISAIEMVADE